MTTATPTLSETAQRQLEMVKAANGKLEPIWLHGYLWKVGHASIDGVFIEYRHQLYNRPYRVTWNTSGDRKVNGKWKAVDYTRSRCFKHLNSALEFIEGF